MVFSEFNVKSSCVCFFHCSFFPNSMYTENAVHRKNLCIHFSTFGQILIIFFHYLLMFVTFYCMVNIFGRLHFICSHFNICWTWKMSQYRLKTNNENSNDSEKSTQLRINNNQWTNETQSHWNVEPFLLTLCVHGKTSPNQAKQTACY